MDRERMNITTEDITTMAERIDDARAGFALQLDTARADIEPDENYTSPSYPSSNDRHIALDSPREGQASVISAKDETELTEYRYINGELTVVEHKAGEVIETPCGETDQGVASWQAATRLLLEIAAHTSDERRGDELIRR